jgi:hypothetical protein
MQPRDKNEVNKCELLHFVKEKEFSEFRKYILKTDSDIKYLIKLSLNI